MNIAHCLLGLLVALPMATQARLVISADAGDSPLVITGWLVEGTGLNGNLRLTTWHDPPEGADTSRVSILMLASDLRSGDGKWTVGRQNVSLGGNPVLLPGVPQDFQVRVSGITEPGTYRGKLELLPSGAARAEALALDLEVIARSRPSLKPLASAEKLRLDLVNCQSRLSCGLAGLLLPESAFLNHWQMQFDNPSAAEAKLIKSALVVLGEKTRFQLSSDQLTLPADPQSFPAHEISSLPVTLHRAAMAPDHYLGSLYLMLEGAKDRLTIPLDMNVRTGPLWPLVAILAGIILGRLVKYMQERGGPQAAKLAEVNRVERMLSHAPDEDRKILEPQVAELRRKVYQHALDTVTAELKTIEARLETLGKLRDMEDDLRGEDPSAEKDRALQQITEARRRVADGEDVSDLVAGIKQTLEGLKHGLTAKGIPGVALEHALKTADEAETAAGRAKPSLESLGTENRVLRWIRNTLFALSGLSEELRAEATLWIVRPLLYFVLLFALVAVGLSTLYVNTGLTFGATPFADYLGLVLWGLSADVAGRTLSNLQGTNPSGKGQ